MVFDLFFCFAFLFYPSFHYSNIPVFHCSVYLSDQPCAFQRGQEIDRVLGCLVLGHFIRLRDRLHNLAHVRPAIEKVPDQGTLFVQRENGVQVLGPSTDGNNDRFTRDLPRDKIVLFHKAFRQVIHVKQNPLLKSPRPAD
jgi:hypothetical protein